MMRYFLGLGSNLGDKRKNLARAFFFLEKEGVRILKASSVYETEPVDFSCESWFFNQVIEAETQMKPKAFLDLVQKIEQKMGRIHQGKKSSRIIDIDILLAERMVIKTKELEIPHPRMDKRNFVLVPFVEIAPDTIHPLFGESISALRRKSRDRSIVKRIKEPRPDKQG
jgi:2-amino-4-hydroxy-6-hydroxymethyldihydropteridine diphosphokinase